MESVGEFWEMLGRHSEDSDDERILVPLGWLRAIAVQETEYRQVAGIVCLDVDLLDQIAAGSRDLESLKKHVAMTKARKDQAVDVPEKRRQRYESLSCTFTLAAAGLVRCSTIEEVGRDNH